MSGGKRIYQGELRRKKLNEGEENMKKVSSKTSLKVLLVIVLLALVLFVSNPEKNHFVDWAVRRAERQSQTELESFLGGFVGRPLLNVATTRENYYFFSLFKVNVGGEENIFLGFFRYIFIQVR